MCVLVRVGHPTPHPTPLRVRRCTNVGFFVFYKFFFELSKKIETFQRVFVQQKISEKRISYLLLTFSEPSYTQECWAPVCRRKETLRCPSVNGGHKVVLHEVPTINYLPFCQQFFILPATLPASFNCSTFGILY